MEGYDVASRIWYYHGKDKVIIAKESDGKFEASTFNGAKGIQKGSTNSGIVLQGALQPGSYSVTVVLKDSYGRKTPFKSGPLIAELNEAFPIENGKVKMEIEGIITKDSKTNWSKNSLTLKCGKVVAGTTPPFTMEWVDTDDDVLPSSGYNVKEGYFYVHLPDNANWESYRCRVPAKDVQKACF